MLVRIESLIHTPVVSWNICSFTLMSVCVCMFSPIITMCWHLHILSAKKPTVFNWLLTGCADSCHTRKWVVCIHVLARGGSVRTDAHYSLA